MGEIIRVAQIMGNMNGGGVEAVVLNYFRNIDRNRVHFDFIIHNTSTHVPKEEIEHLGGRVIFVPHYKKIFKYRKAISKIFKDNNYDIVHSHINTASVFPLRIAKKSDIKVRIAHAHSTSNRKEFIRNIIKNLLKLFSKKYATHFFACSEYAGVWMFGEKTFQKGKITIINNAIDMEKFKFNDEIRQKIRNELNLNNKHVIGHVGRFMTQKNHKFLLDIFLKVQKEREDAILLLLGDGPLIEEIKDIVKSLKLTESVIFMGNVSETEKYYNVMDCFVLPSLYEGLPVVGIEAQLNGLPCFFSSNITKEVCLLDSTKLLPVIDCNLWANQILGATEINRLIGYETIVNTKYDIKHEAKRLLEIYKKSINEGIA